MRYEIEGNNLPVVICHLEEGEKIITEQVDGLDDTEYENGNKFEWYRKSSRKDFFGRIFFQNIYYPCRGRGKGMIAFASSFPGTILPFEIEPGNEIIAQKKHFSQQQKECSCLLFLIKNRSRFIWW